MERHPPELRYLFLTEMWERFSFYLMLGLLTLYMTTSKDSGGLGFDEAKAATVFGTYMALVYLTPFIGGILADRVLGYRKSVLIGAVVMCLGHISLAFESVNMFYLGLFLLIVGNGFFKPNISAMLGRLYPPGSKLKDSGFGFFYLGVNLGAFICNFVAAIVRNKYGWHAAFGTAGIGLFIGLLTFGTIYKSLARAETTKEVGVSNQSNESLRSLLIVSLVALFATAPLGYWIMGVTGAFFGACIPVIAFYIWLWWTAAPNEKGALGALLAICALLIPFWMVFNLNGTTLTFWAESNTEREVPEWSTATLAKVDLLQKAPVKYFINASADTPRPDPSSLKIVSGNKDEITSYKQAYAKKVEMEGHEKAGPLPVTQDEFDKVYQNSGDKTLKPGEPLHVANPELFQSVNPFFIILLTPVLVWAWRILRNRKKEPTTPGKMAIGMLFAAVCWLVMLFAVYKTNDGSQKASSLWLIHAYFWITMGELCLSPIGLSLVSKLAPPRLVAVMMGGFFLCIAIGNKLSGIAGGPVWESVSHSSFFIGLTIIMVVFAAIIRLLLPWLKRHLPNEERDSHAPSDEA
ncbi:MAG: peptide MFS transporter [Patescibacteria group bacterium]